MTKLEMFANNFIDSMPSLAHAVAVAFHGLTPKNDEDLEMSIAYVTAAKWRFSRHEGDVFELEVAEPNPFDVMKNLYYEEQYVGFEFFDEYDDEFIDDSGYITVKQINDGGNGLVSCGMSIKLFDAGISPAEWFRNATVHVTNWYVD